MLTQLKRFMALMVLCVLMARPAQAQDEFELEEDSYIVSGMLLITFKEGHDEFVECLRWAANQGKVKVGGCAQIAGLKVPGYKSLYGDWWDELAATMDLVRIEEGSRYFILVFPPFQDRLTAYRLNVFYASLPYVEDVEFIDLLKTTISETTWGFIKHRELDLSRKASMLRIEGNKQW